MNSNFKLITSNERYFNNSEIHDWIFESPLELFDKYIKEYHIKKIHGKTIVSLLNKVDKEWKYLDGFHKLCILYRFIQLFNKFRDMPLPTIKEPLDSTKYGCLFLYNEADRIKENPIYTNKSEKCYLSCFFPLMKARNFTFTPTDIYYFQFPVHKGDKLRNYEIISQTKSILKDLTNHTDYIENILTFSSSLEAEK